MSDQLHAEFHLPATELATAAYAFAERVEPRFVFDHSVRSYLYARELAGQQDLRPGVDYDDELVFLSCVLHDLGLSEAGNRDQRFEVDGADLAAEFLREHGVDEHRVSVVWDAIALHTSDGIASRKGPNIAVTQAGIAADILGLGRDHLPAELIDRVHAVFPRADLGFALTDAIVAQAMDKPGKASPTNFPGQLLPPGTMPDWRTLIALSGWGDQPHSTRRP